MFQFYFALNVLDQIYWFFLVFKGTASNVLFTNVKMTIFALFMAIDIVLIFVRISWFVDQAKEE